MSDPTRGSGTITRSIHLREVDYQRQVTDTASLLGYEWCHWRAARTAHGWAVPVEGPLGAGWPDLTLARQRDGRLVYVELKANGRRVTGEQRHVIDLLARCGEEVYVWSADRDTIEQIAEILR